MSTSAAVAILRDAYPRADFPDATVRLYIHMLQDLDEHNVGQAVRRLILRSDFLPSIAAIRQEVAEAALKLPSAEEAWDIVCTGSIRNAPPEVQAASEACGGRWAIMSSDRVETLRAQFTKDYLARRRRAVDVFTGAAVPRVLPEALQRQLGPTVRALPETERVRPRPMMARVMRRWGGLPPQAPTEVEKADAIDVLRQGAHADDPSDDPLYREAEAVFMEVGW